MPDKDGDDEKKSTKSVVNKKQKQMMGEQQQKKIIPSGQGLTDYSKIPSLPGLGGGGGGTDSIMAPGTSKSLKKRVGDLAKVLTFPFHKRRVDPTEKFASEEFIPEEGYDIARDMGRVRPSKDKKDATTMPVSKEMKKTRKVNKGPSALELVKKKYGKAVMKVGKKKANEELDLTQVAEAFGGYIIESEFEIRKIKGKTYFYPSPDERKKKKNIVKKPTPFTKPIKPADPSLPDPFADIDQTKIPDDIKKDIEQGGGTDPRFKKSSEGRFSKTGGTVKEPVTGTSQAKGSKPKDKIKLADDPSQVGRASEVKIIKKGKKPTSSTPPPKFTSDEIRASQDAKRQQKGKDRIIDVDAGETTGELTRTASAKIEKPQKETKKPRSATKASPRELKQTQKEIEKSKLDPKRLGQPVVPSPVKTMGKDGQMKNRPLPAFGSQMTDYWKQSPAGIAKMKGIDVDTGKKFDMTNPQDYDKFMKVTGSSKRAKDSAKFRTQSPDSAITRTGTDLAKVGTPTKGGSIVSKAAKDYTKFVKANPVLGGVSGLAAYDLGKGILSKIMNLRGPGIQGGKAGFRSAGR